jgi:hypothetical protein
MHYKRGVAVSLRDIQPTQVSASKFGVSSKGWNISPLPFAGSAPNCVKPLLSPLLYINSLENGTQTCTRDFRSSKFFIHYFTQSQPVGSETIFRISKLEKQIKIKISIRFMQLCLFHSCFAGSCSGALLLLILLLLWHQQSHKNSLIKFA